MNKSLYISAVFFGLACLTRSDSIIFVLIAIPLVKKEYLKFSIISVLPFLLWNLYLHIVGLNSDVFGWPTMEKLEILRVGMVKLMFGMTWFGVTFYAFIGIFLHRLYDRKQLRLGLLIIAMFVGNAVLYLCLDHTKMGASYEQIINDSFRRSLFTFVPLCWFYVWRG